MIMVIVFTTPVTQLEPDWVAQSIKYRANSQYWAGACIFPAPADRSRGPSISCIMRTWSSVAGALRKFKVLNLSSGRLHCDMLRQIKGLLYAFLLGFGWGKWFVRGASPCSVFVAHTAHQSP
jgi:hypothetical protein